MARFILLFFYIQSATASSVLLIGDSHTVGPFGQSLHNLLTDHYNQVITLGHSSSAAYHWMSERDFKLSGGIFHKATRSNSSRLHPNPPASWRTRVSVPKMDTILQTPYVHESWKNELGEFATPETAVIALGANDTNIVATPAGERRSSGYLQRGQAINDLIRLIISKGMKCVWIAPPAGLKIPQSSLDITYQMISEFVGDQCSIFSSRHYKSEGCDGIHFSCASQRPKAIQWANEVIKFIQNPLVQSN